MKNLGPTIKRLAALSVLSAAAVAPAEGGGPYLTPDDALQRLQAGNTRFVSGGSTHPNTSTDRMADTFENGQHPFATVIACSDSRVPVERLFDQGIGDVFVIRVAGNVCDVDETGSIEYGVDHLDTPVLVVLGHTGCGAVTAVATGAELHGSIPPLVDNIKPAVEAAQKEHPHLRGRALVPEAVKANVWQSIDNLLRISPATRRRVQGDTLDVVGAIYDIKSGHVDWLGAHPQQDRLLAYTGGPSHDQAMSVHPAHGDGAEHGDTAVAGYSHVSAADQAAVAGIMKELASNKTPAKHEKAVSIAGHGDTWLYLIGAVVFLVAVGLSFYFARRTDQTGNTRLRWTLGAKLISGSSIVILGMTGASMYGLTSMASIGAQLDEMSEEIIPLTNSCMGIDVHLLEQGIALERAFRFGREDGAHAEVLFNESVKRFEDNARLTDNGLADAEKFLEEMQAHTEEGAAVIVHAMKTLTMIDVERHELEIMADMRTSRRSSRRTTPSLQAPWRYAPSRRQAAHKARQSGTVGAAAQVAVTRLRPRATFPKSDSSYGDGLSVIGAARCKRKIVVIGASTGGPAAGKEILGNLPREFPLPILVAIHCSSRLSSSVAGWFDRECSLHVSDARDGELLPEEPGVVLTAPPARNLRICGGRTVLVDAADNIGCTPSVDELFTSAAANLGDATIGVLLTGMGADGAEGLKRIKDLGGCTITQDEDSCVVFGMPAAAIKLGAAEHITPLHNIPELLIQLTGQSRRTDKPTGVTP